MKVIKLIHEYWGELEAYNYTDDSTFNEKNLLKKMNVLADIDINSNCSCKINETFETEEKKLNRAEKVKLYKEKKNKQMEKEAVKIINKFSTSDFYQDSELFAGSPIREERKNKKEVTPLSNEEIEKIEEHRKQFIERKEKRKLLLEARKIKRDNLIKKKAELAEKRKIKEEKRLINKIKKEAIKQKQEERRNRFKS